jgi:hypothetical protein
MAKIAEIDGLNQLQILATNLDPAGTYVDRATGPSYNNDFI